MKCTKCSELIRPVVVFDIDGTLAEYHNELAKFCINYWNLSAVTGDVAYLWEGEGKFRDCLKITQDEYREAKLAFRQGGMKRVMPPYEDGFELIEFMDKCGLEIWYATSRPWQRLDNVDPDTRFWLERWDLPVDGLMFDLEDKYGKLIRDHLSKDRIIGIIDDLPEQYDRASELGLPVWQVARRHNSGPTVKRPNRGTMLECRDWLVQNLKDWRNKNG